MTTLTTNEAIGVRYCQNAEQKQKTPTLFDLLAANNLEIMS